MTTPDLNLSTTHLSLDYFRSLTGSRPLSGLQEGEIVGESRTNVLLPPHLSFSSKESPQKDNSNCSIQILTRYWWSASAKTTSLPAPWILSVLDPFTLRLRSSVVRSLHQSPLKIMASYVVYSQGKFPRWGYFSVDEGQGCRAKQNSPSFSCISALTIWRSLCFTFSRAYAFLSLKLRQG